MNNDPYTSWPFMAGLLIVTALGVIVYVLFYMGK